MSDGARSTSLQSIPGRPANWSPSRCAGGLAATSGCPRRPSTIESGGASERLFRGCSSAVAFRMGPGSHGCRPGSTSSSSSRRHVPVAGSSCVTTATWGDARSLQTPAFRRGRTGSVRYDVERALSQPARGPGTLRLGPDVLVVYSYALKMVSEGRLISAIWRSRVRPDRILACRLAFPIIGTNRLENLRSGPLTTTESLPPRSSPAQTAPIASRCLELEAENAPSYSIHRESPE
jgi:hypothetical protein